MNVDAEAAEHVAKMEEVHTPKGGGQHLAGMNREQYRRARRVFGHVHQGKHPHGQLTTRRARLVNRMTTRAAGK